MKRDFNVHLFLRYLVSWINIKKEILMHIEIDKIDSADSPRLNAKTTMVTTPEAFGLGDADFDFPLDQEPAELYQKFSYYITEYVNLKDTVYAYPLYLYDDNGITLTIDPEDTIYQVGYIYSKGYLPFEVFQEEIEQYNHYIKGNTYVFRLYQPMGEQEVDIGIIYSDTPIEYLKHNLHSNYQHLIEDFID